VRPAKPGERGWGEARKAGGEGKTMGGKAGREYCVCDGMDVDLTRRSIEPGIMNCITSRMRSSESNRACHVTPIDLCGFA